jgi:hypothetical protein
MENHECNQIDKFMKLSHFQGSVESDIKGINNSVGDIKKDIGELFKLLRDLSKEIMPDTEKEPPIVMPPSNDSEDNWVKNNWKTIALIIGTAIGTAVTTIQATGG